MTNAQAAISLIDTALDSVNTIRSGFGAVQNRLDSAINNATVNSEALSAAQSQDTDFASETSNLTRLQIMQQAGVASLAQAKNINQSVIAPQLLANGGRLAAPGAAHLALEPSFARRQAETRMSILPRRKSCRSAFRASRLASTPPL